MNIGDICKRIKDEPLKPFYEEDVIHDLFSWKELDNILNLRPFINAKRFHMMGVPKYTWTPYGYETEPSSVPPDIILEALEKGTFYIQDASRVNSKVNKVAGMIERASGKPCDAHIYFLTNKDVKTVNGVHWDYSHKLIVQVAGATQFNVWEDPIYDIKEGYQYRQYQPKNVTHIKEDPFISEVLQAGDVMYVPCYHWHQEIAQTKKLTFSFPYDPFVLNGVGAQNRLWIRTSPGKD